MTAKRYIQLKASFDYLRKEAEFSINEACDALLDRMCTEEELYQFLQLVLYEIEEER